MRPHLYRAVGLLAAITLFGCTPPPPAPTTKSAEKFSNRTESDDPHAAASEMKSFTPTDDGASSEKLLAQKLAAYSKEVGPQMRDRAERKKLNAVGTGGDSAVKWTDPNGIAIAPTTVPSDTPVSNPTTNPVTIGPKSQALATPANKASDVPQIIPEGEDTIAPVGPQVSAADTDALVQQLAGKIKENPRDVVSNLDYQLLQYLRGEQVPEMKSITGLAGEDREVVTAFLDGLSNFRNNARNDNNQMLSEKIQPLVDMADRLRGQADLTLPNAALCTRVDGYGVYDPIEPAHFGAGKDHPVIVYCEVANFASQINEKKLWETKLSNEVILYTDTGMVAWSEKSKSIVDTSRNRRHDFFLIKKTKLPSTLPIGRYILKISVTDQESNRVAETNIQVQIAAE